MNRSSLHSGALPSLLTTSLRIPQLRGDLLTRSILIEKMDHAFHYPLTLISAPAGFGKTTLLSQWISGSQDQNLQNRVAWVSLDSECDLRQFWTYILFALEQVQPGIGASALALLKPSQPPIQTILRTIINDISVFTDDFVLILDDYHLVDDPSIHTAFTYFVNHLPSNLHLVVSSRNQPPVSLARWRASNLLYELGEKDLRLTRLEVATFFNEIKQLNLSPEETTALGTRTEGWIAGLQLVALSLQGFDDASKHNFVSAFTGSQRYILDYLVEEVLQRQSENIRTFLLQTSVLERMNASICNAITGQMDGQAKLEHLERAQIFTIPLDLEQGWYRYHHLFRDVLYHRLSQTEPDFVLELHRRAAAWYIHARQIDDAIRHACAAHEWDQAIELIEPAINDIWNRGEVRKIISWLGRLPDEYLDSHPELYSYYLRALLHGGQVEVAERRLREAEASLRTHPGADSSMGIRLRLGTILALRTTIVAVSDKPERALALGREALSLLPPGNMDIQAYAINSVGVANYYLGNIIEAAQNLAEGGELARKAGHIFTMVAAITYQAKALISQGHLKQARQILEQVVSLSSPSERNAQSGLRAAGFARAILGNLLYEWNRSDEAERCLIEAIELGQQLAYGSALWSAYHTLARIKLIQSDQKGAEFQLEQAQRHRLTYTVLIPPRLMDADEARTSMAIGKLEDAKRWARSLSMHASPSPGFVQEVENITLARLYLHEGKPGQALALLEQIYPAVHSSSRNGHVIEILVLTALAQSALAEEQAAIHTLHTALRLAEPEGYVRTFVDGGPPMAALLDQALSQGIMPDYTRRLLAAFSADEMISSTPGDNSGSLNTRLAQDGLVEPLSQRELEVLQLIANGATNVAIAQDLIIATTTAKKHVSNIIQKLGVENRMQAAVKGRNLGLCD